MPCVAQEADLVRARLVEGRGTYEDASTIPFEDGATQLGGLGRSALDTFAKGSRRPLRPSYGAEGPGANAAHATNPGPPPVNDGARKDRTRGTRHRIPRTALDADSRGTEGESGPDVQLRTRS